MVSRVVIPEQAAHDGDGHLRLGHGAGESGLNVHLAFIIGLRQSPIDGCVGIAFAPGSNGSDEAATTKCFVRLRAGPVNGVLRRTRGDAAGQLKKFFVGGGSIRSWKSFNSRSIR